MTCEDRRCCADCANYFYDGYDCGVCRVDYEANEEYRAGWQPWEVAAVSMVAEYDDACASFVEA